MDRAQKMLVIAQSMEIFQACEWVQEWYSKAKDGENKERLFKTLMILTEAELTLKHQSYEIEKLSTIITEDRLRLSAANHESESLRAENTTLRESIDSVL